MQPTTSPRSALKRRRTALPSILGARIKRKSVHWYHTYVSGSVSFPRESSPTLVATLKDAAAITSPSTEIPQQDNAKHTRIASPRVPGGGGSVGDSPIPNQDALQIGDIPTAPESFDPVSAVLRGFGETPQFDDPWNALCLVAATMAEHEFLGEANSNDGRFQQDSEEYGDGARNQGSELTHSNLETSWWSLGQENRIWVE